MRTAPTIRPLRPADVAACESLLRALPQWFGIERSLVAYVHELETLETDVAEVDGRVAGFLAVRRHNPHAAEIHVMAVAPERHRTGIGRVLVARAETRLRVAGVVLLQVKTRGPSAPDPDYARTRAFYAALGFLPLEETTAFWGEEDPCLVMVKPLR
jgi:GNAT superfamily N-acetyltransferase